MADWEEKFGKICEMTHSEQGIWWLNGFWEDGAKDYAEDMWVTVHQFIECQLGEPVRYGTKMQEFKEGCDLDELQSHRILEIMGETMTVLALRKRLKELDLDNNKRMALSEYLLDKYKKKPAELVVAPQGDVDPAELARCQEACDSASAALDQASADAQAAAAALKASQAAAAEAASAKTQADEALAKAQAAEEAVKKAEAELQASLDEIAALEKAKQDLIDKCQKIIDDPNAGAVKKGRAVQEKEQTLCEDPLPLSRAKITQKAALKKVEKARKLCEEETAKSAAAAKAAAEAKEAADAAEQEAESTKATAEAAQAAAEVALKEAQSQLDALKSKGGGSPQGKLWWMERLLAEKKKYTK